jgi:hypothetical protein
MVVEGGVGVGWVSHPTSTYQSHDALHVSYTVQVAGMELFKLAGLWTAHWMRII